jgi:hypothetical protein
VGPLACQRRVKTRKCWYAEAKDSTPSLAPERAQGTTKAWLCSGTGNPPGLFFPASLISASMWVTTGLAAGKAPQDDTYSE